MSGVSTLSLLEPGAEAVQEGDGCRVDDRHHCSAVGSTQHQHFAVDDTAPCAELDASPILRHGAHGACASSVHSAEKCTVWARPQIAMLTEHQPEVPGGMRSPWTLHGSWSQEFFQRQSELHTIRVQRAACYWVHSLAIEG